jgi:hypothetical protein
MRYLEKKDEKYRLPVIWNESNISPLHSFRFSYAQLLLLLMRQLLPN